MVNAHACGDGQAEFGTDVLGEDLAVVVAVADAGSRSAPRVMTGFDGRCRVFTQVGDEAADDVHAQVRVLAGRNDDEAATIPREEVMGVELATKVLVGAGGVPLHQLQVVLGG
ncbi:hypothetical protein [Streptomyces sp. NPDC050528]|uniref:hypothetical protein n=1 Tax=Streptomyces sp. NPDC050528 TaxID=3365623 RepID=UPI0037B31011